MSNQYKVSSVRAQCRAPAPLDRQLFKLRFSFCGNSEKQARNTTRYSYQSNGQTCRKVLGELGVAISSGENHYFALCRQPEGRRFIAFSPAWTGVGRNEAHDFVNAGLENVKDGLL